MGNKNNKEKINIINPKDYKKVPFNIFFLKDGNNGKLLLIYPSIFEIRNSDTFELIKEVSLEMSQIKKNFSKAILYSNDEIIICDKKYNIEYIKLDNEYNIINLIFSHISKYNINDKLLEKKAYDVYLKCLKAKKFAYITQVSIEYLWKIHYSAVQLSEIYILSLNKNTNQIISEMKIKAYDAFLYEAKSRNEYLIYFKSNNIFVLNSKNFKIKKNYPFPSHSIPIRMFYYYCIVNDNYLLEHNYNKKELNLFNLTNFNKIKTFKANEDFKIFHLKKNIFIISEYQRKFIKSKEIIKICQFDEKNEDIISLKKFYFHEYSDKIISKGNNYLDCIRKVKGSENLYFIKFDNISSGPKVSYLYIIIKLND